MSISSDVFSNTLIIANPGTGKTAAIADRVISLLKAGINEKDILCITFTNKAATEMRERINIAVKNNKIDAKPYLINIHTFHSYAYDYLEEIGSGYELISNNMLRYSIFRSFQNDNAFNYTTKYIIEEIVPKTENAIRYLKSFGILPNLINIEKSKNELQSRYKKSGIESITLEEILTFFDYFINAYKNYEIEKDESEVIDYNDMLLKFMELYDKKKRYKHVLVDELQDANELEAELAALSGETLFLVGDRKQAIFGFQGGSIKNFKKFENLKGLKKETKILNYRSLQPILEYSKEHFLKHTKDNSYKDELSGLHAKRTGENSKVHVYIAEKQVNASIKILSNILSKSKNEEKTAIITRTNSQLLELSDMLDKKGIEYSTTAGSSTSEEAKSQIIIYLKGLLYDDKAHILNALFTPFSELTLEEAFKVAEAWQKIGKVNSNKVPEEIYKMADKFFNLKKTFGLESAKYLFNNIIFPISASIGDDYFITAKAINNAMMEFSKINNNKTRDAFFEYLSILEEDYTPIDNGKNVILTTVHKAKGMEFDNVIYIPTGGSLKESFIDMVVYSIIKTSTGIDVSEDLEEEQIRIDFVAFTRAKNNLYIVANKRNNARYTINNFNINDIDSDVEIAPISGKYAESYKLFLNGRYDESKKILNPKSQWLYQTIKNYFSSNHDLSYSLMERADNPYEFLRERILKIEQPSNYSLTLGTRAHELAHLRFNGKLDAKKINDEEKKYLDNIIAIDTEISTKMGFRQILAEYEIRLAVKQIFNNLDTEIGFKAILDIVYESNNKKYLILDWKTDRNEGRASIHRRQLSVYKKVLSINLGIKESDISTAIGFIGLKGNINTKKLGYKLDIEQPKAIQIKTFENHLERFLSYKKEPMLFIQDLMEHKIEDPLYKRLISILNVEK